MSHHFHPESWATVREDRGQALTGARVGRATEHRKDLRGRARVAPPLVEVDSTSASPSAWPRQRTAPQGLTCRAWRRAVGQEHRARVSSFEHDLAGSLGRELAAAAGRLEEAYGQPSRSVPLGIDPARNAPGATISRTVATGLAGADPAGRPMVPPFGFLCQVNTGACRCGAVRCARLGRRGRR